MKQIKNRRFNLLLLLIALVVTVFFGWLIYSQGFQQFGTVRYVSKDLRMSFDYPKRWYVDEKDYAILLTDHYTNLNRDDKPTNNQIELYIREFAGCHPTIEENLKDPACGEGGPQVKPNEIIFKEMKQISDAIFYKYIVKSPSGNQFTFYILEKGDKVIQISKKPDPSQHEKEFEEIVNSMRFL